MKLWVLVLGLSACAATTEPPTGEPPPVGTPSCEHAQRMRDLTCDVAKDICTIAAKKQLAADVQQCREDQERCAASRARVDEKCSNAISTARP